MNQVSAARPHTDVRASGSRPAGHSSSGATKVCLRKVEIQARSFSKGWYLGWFSLPFRICPTVECDLSICLSSLWHRATGSSKRAQISRLSRHYCQQHSVVLEAFTGWLEWFLQQRQSSKDLKMLVRRLLRVFFYFHVFLGGKQGDKRPVQH